MTLTVMQAELRVEALGNFVADNVLDDDEFNEVSALIVALTEQLKETTNEAV